MLQVLHAVAAKHEMLSQRFDQNSKLWFRDKVLAAVDTQWHFATVLQRRATPRRVVDKTGAARRRNQQVIAPRN